MRSLTQHIDELRTAFPIAGLTLANGHRTFSKVMGFARAQPILRATGYGLLLRRRQPVELLGRQKENARGERAFSVVNLGVVGVFYYPRGDFGGLVKSRVNS